MNDLKLIPAIGETPELAQKKTKSFKTDVAIFENTGGGEMNFSTFTDYVK